MIFCEKYFYESYIRSPLFYIATGTFLYIYMEKKHTQAYFLFMRDFSEFKKQ